MAPCGGNVVTPRMIRKGEVHIGDKIKLEEASAAVPTEATASAEPAAIRTAAENAVDCRIRNNAVINGAFNTLFRQTIAKSTAQPHFL